jgi:DNA-directed RNA polymerase subunit RPC12/RpoP
MAIRFSCGSCGRKFAANDDQAGRQGKCPACGWPIAVPLVATQEEGDSPSPPPVPAGLSTIPARPHWAISQRAILGASLLANFLLLLVGVCSVWPQSRWSQGGPCDYRDVLLEMKLWPRRSDRFGAGRDEKSEKVYRESRDFWTEMIRSMPEGREGMRLLVDTSEFFMGDTIDLWVQCRSCSTEVANDGIKIQPIDALKALHQYVAGCWPIFFQQFDRKKVNARGEFFVPYRHLRQEGLTHQQAVSEMIDREWRSHRRTNGD